MIIVFFSFNDLFVTSDVNVSELKRLSALEVFSRRLWTDFCFADFTDRATQTKVIHSVISTTKGRKNSSVSSHRDSRV